MFKAISSRASSTRTRRGVTSVLAMIYLIIFSVLAVGFYTSTNTAMMVSANEVNASRALLAAESGLEFMRYQLMLVRLPPNVTDSQLVTEVYNDLAAQINGTGNANLKTVVMTTTTIPAAKRNQPPTIVPLITIPQIKCNQMGDSFKAQIIPGGVPLGTELTVKITGNSGSSSLTSRAIQMTFKSTPNDSVFRYGVAAKQKVELGGDFDLIGEFDALDGSIQSSSTENEPVHIHDKSSVSGDVFMTNPKGRVHLDGKATVAGYDEKDPEVDQHIHKGVAPPEFPTIDASKYKPFATTVLRKNMLKKTTTFNNILIPPRLNPDFPNRCTLNGVIYVQMPNKLNFDKHVKVNGIIIYEPAPGFVKETDNHIEFHDGSTMNSMEALPVNTMFPQAMHDLGAATIIAPQSDVKFSGGNSSDLGMIFTDDFHLNGHWNMSVYGNIISNGKVHLEHKSSMRILRPKNDKRPVAFRFSAGYLPIPASYDEVKP